MDGKGLAETGFKCNEFCGFGCGSVTLWESDGGVELQHDIVAVRAHSGNCTRDPVGIGHRVIDGVSQFTEQILQEIVELQGVVSRTSLAILGPAIVGYKRASLRCL